ncbi:hypothetical protein V5E97_26305 [Singulisphaera sp. Ch08]|uniref:Uncharacterized protein n=1 Tax=Singulisphaera sp. Ch08 TaxID=3120278 RepID=A0AAU7C9K6_9BACT
MAVVAIVAVSLAAAQVESAPRAAIAIIGACLFYLGYERYSAALTQRRVRGLTTSGLQKAVILLDSAIFSVSVIGFSDIAFLIGYYGFMKIAYKAVVMSHWTPYNDSGFMATGVVIGGILALCVASSLRRTIDREKLRYSHRWLNLWPVGLVIFLGIVLGSEEMRERYSFCQMMAAYHAGPNAQMDGLKNAAAHAWLRQWYERASIRPWLPVHPDRVPPSLE